MAKFTKPPLSEVVFGVEFNAPEFSSVDFGFYWQEIKERFPLHSDRQPIERVLPGGMEITLLPPLRRVWFESLDKLQVLQLQENRFHYNWRQQDSSEEYPHFEKICPEFLREWEYFQRWWSDKTSRTPVRPTAYELTYLNQIDKNFGWIDTNDHQKIFTFIGKEWNNSLSKPVFLNSELAFLLPEKKGLLNIRVSQQTRTEDQSNVIFFELTARSTELETDLTGWFNTAHEHIVKAFLDLTQKSIYQEWGYSDNSN